jgi:putative oxidoreductase
MWQGSKSGSREARRDSCSPAYFQVDFRIDFCGTIAGRAGWFFCLIRVLKKVLGGGKMIDQRLAPWATLLLRVSLGLLFIAHLYWKFVILDGGLDKWWTQFAANGYPAITPWYCLSAEFAGALLLIPGIWTRWVALYALPLIFGAAQFWAVRKGFYFTIGGAEMSLTWGLMLVLQVLLGDGPYAAVPSPMPRAAVSKMQSA